MKIIQRILRFFIEPEILGQPVCVCGVCGNPDAKLTVEEYRVYLQCMKCFCIISRKK